MSHQDTYKTNIYVLNADGSPFMPCHSQRKARKWLKTGKAKIACQLPYTLQLTKQIENPGLQPVILGLDGGPDNIVIHAIDEQGRSLLAADTATDNAQVTKHMTKRRECRRASRQGERKRRQRRQHRVDCGSKKVVYERLLPQCDETTKCKSIRNSKARYCNRTRPAGWVTPTTRNLIRTHVNLVGRIAELLPISLVSFEANKFDFSRMKMCDDRTWDKVIAPLTGYADAHNYINAIQGGKCLLCEHDIEQYHHVKGRKKHGSDTVANLAGLCSACHEHVHKDAAAEQALLTMTPGQDKVFGKLSILNQAVPFIIYELAQRYELFITDGKATSDLRKALELPKSKGTYGHFFDAYCIALNALGGAGVLGFMPDEESLSAHYHVVRQYRRHDRARVHYQKMRTYKDVNGKTVAKNRRKAMGQLGDSLSEYREKFGDDAVSRLTCKPSKRSYKDPSRVLPGAIFVDERGHRYVLTGQSSGGKVFVSGDERYGTSRCRIVRHNEGLVFVS